MNDSIENVDTKAKVTAMPGPPRNGVIRVQNEDGTAELLSTSGVVRTTSTPEPFEVDGAREAARRLLGNRPTANTIAERLSEGERESLVDLYERLEADLMDTVSLDDYEETKRELDASAKEALLPQGLAAYSIIADIGRTLGDSDGTTKVYEFAPGVRIESAGGNSDVSITNELRYLTYEVRDDEGALKTLILERSSEAQGNATFVLRNDDGELEHSSILTDLFSNKLSRRELRETYQDETGNTLPVNPQRPVNHDYYDIVDGQRTVNPAKYQRYLDRIAYWATCPVDKFRLGNQAVPRSFGRAATNGS